MVGRADLHDLGEGNLDFGPLLLDDLDIVDHLGRRAKLQWTSSSICTVSRWASGARFQFFSSPVRPLARLPQSPRAEIVLAQRKQLGRRQAVGIGALAPPAGSTQSAFGAATANCSGR